MQTDGRLDIHLPPAKQTPSRQFQDTMPTELILSVLRKTRIGSKNSQRAPLH